MSLWTYQKGKIGLSAKWSLLGYPVYEIIDTENVRTRIFCKGLISSRKIYDYFFGTRLKEFWFFGLRISYCGIQNHCCVCSILGCVLYNKAVNDLIYDKYKDFIPKETDYIFIISSGLGELYCFLSFILKGFLKKNNIQNPLFLFTNKYHRTLFSLFVPEISSVFVNKNYFWEYQGEFMIHGIRSRCLFPVSYFQWVENEIRRNSSFFADCMLRHFSTSPQEIYSLQVHISGALRDRVFNKLLAAGLKDCKYVFLATYANSCISIPQEFWQNLIDYLNSRGLKILLNTKDDSLKGDCYYIPLSIDEALVAAQGAQFIIGLRSGLMDLLLQAGRPMYIIYTGFPQRTHFLPLSDIEVLHGFDLKKIPCPYKKAKIYSYLYNPNLLHQLIKNFK